MHFSTLLGLAAGIASAQAISTGFNYGNQMSDGTFKDQATYEAEFKRAQSLQGTDGAFTSARLYTMIQGGTTDTPTVAIQAAIDTKTTLLLGLWASVDQDAFANEISALKSAIGKYGGDFTDLVVGISVGSEDLYRVSPTGIENDSDAGSTPDQLVSYIKQTRDAIQGTSLSAAKIGHVDTWTAWVNESNFAVTDNCDWLGVDSYPYFQNTVANSIENGNKTFWDSYDATVGASKGKEVWVTETGWPVSGKVDGDAVASIKNAETYWQEVACALIGNYNTWYYTLQDDLPETPKPSFGIIGADLNSDPLYDLTCKKTSSASKPSSGPGAVPSSDGTTPGHASPTSGSAASASASAGASPNTASKAGAAAGAGILAVFGLMAAL